jgi:hypothetical protein
MAQRVDEVFPGAVRSWYLTGSAADGTEVSTSDVDMVVVLRDGGSGEEWAAIQSMVETLAREAGIELDLDLLAAGELATGVDPQLKLGSRLLCGEDLVADAPLLPIEDWARERMHAAYYLMISVFGRPPVVREPLAYPDANDPFFGYASRDVILPDGMRVPSTRNLVRVSGWMATALLAWQRGRYVVRKRECHLLYRQEIGDEWSDFLERVYTRCRGQWQYLIPGDDAGREELRALCERMSAFERYYLGVYRRFLLGELKAGEGRRDRALWVLEQIRFEDPEVEAAVAETGRPNRV